MTGASGETLQADPSTLCFLRTATVFVRVSAGVLHSCGHVVGGLHIWRAPHPEASFPWKI